MRKPCSALFTAPRYAARSHQRGVYALEWAIIFPVFFMLLYALISFGLAFLVRESMQWVAEDGVRAALQHQSSRAQRVSRAREIIKSNLSGWLPPNLVNALDQPGNFRFQICTSEGTFCTDDMAAQTPVCNASVGQFCMVQLSISLPYAQQPLTPSLTMGLMELAMPNMQARARILVDQQGF